MKAAGLHGVSRRKRPSTTIRAEGARPAPDLIERDFSAERPDVLWVADITYVPTWTGFLSLAVVLDAFNRKVVGWAMAKHLRTKLVLSALAPCPRVDKQISRGAPNYSSNSCRRVTGWAFTETPPEVIAIETFETHYPGLSRPTCLPISTKRRKHIHTPRRQSPTPPARVPGREKASAFLLPRRSQAYRPATRPRAQLHYSWYGSDPENSIFSLTAAGTNSVLPRG